MFNKIFAGALLAASVYGESTIGGDILDDTQELLDDTTGWFQDNTWALGILYIVVGILVALYGLKMFPVVSSALAALAGFSILYMMCEGLSWTDSTGGMWTCLIISILAGCIIFYFVRREIWLMVGALTAIGGFMGGVFLLTLITGMTGYSEAWLWWTLGVVGAILGFVLGKRFGGPAVNLVTSFIGSYLVTKALTMFFWTEHWPSDAAIMAGDVDYDNMGW